MLTVDLFEEIYSTLAIGYHRTRNLANTTAIGESGFKIGDRSMYGPGVYLTYSFDDQQDDRMKSTYGPFVIRCKVSLQDFLIFDPEVAMRVYPRAHTVSDQMRHFGAPPKWQHNPHLHSQFTSEAALKFVQQRRNIPLTRPIKGLVFSGRQDGRVIVAYDASSVTAFGWARVTDLGKTRETVKWNKIEAPTTAKGLAHTVSNVEQAYRFFRQHGFTLISRGPVGATLIGMVDQLYVSIKIHDSKDPASTLVEAYATRKDPAKLPDYARRAGLRLFWNTFTGRLPLTQILAKLMHAATSWQEVKVERIRFATALVRRLINPGVPIGVQSVDGVDLRRDEVRIDAGPVKMVFDDPYAEMLTGKVEVATKPLDVRLGFSDGTRDSAEPDLDLAYHTILNSCMWMSGAEKAFFRREADLQTTLPAELSPEFRADLVLYLSERPAQSQPPKNLSRAD